MNKLITPLKDTRQPLLYKKARKLLVDPLIGGRVPRGQPVQFRGDTWLAVDHSPANIRILNLLGYKVPEPMRTHYEYPDDAFHAQIETSIFLTQNRRAFCLNDIGTGKTRAALFAFDYLKQAGLADKMLVMAPLSTLTDAWVREIFREFPHLDFNLLYKFGMTGKKRQALLDIPADIYIINYEGVKVLRDALLARKDIDTICIDEIAILRNTQTDRWKAINDVVQAREHVWGMTGSPTPNGPQDAYGQAKLIVPATTPVYFGQYRDTVMVKFGQYDYHPAKGWQAVVAKLLSPNIRFTRAECLDLPPTMVSTRFVDMGPKQKSVYKQIVDHYRAISDEGGITAANAAVAYTKLVQISCGYVYGDRKKPIRLDNDSRLTLLKELLEGAANKVLVFVPFKFAVANVFKYCQSEKFGTALVTGDVSVPERNKIFSRFRDDDKLKVIVAHPKTMSHGLTLTSADTVIWFSPPNGAEQYEQANGRITRPGQKSKTFVIHIVASNTERVAFSRVSRRLGGQAALLEILNG